MSSKSHTFTGKFVSKEDEFTSQCETIIRTFQESNDIIQAGRNTLKKILFEGSICVVKAFFIPKFPQNYSYGILSTSKAKKSFNNGNRLLSLGFHTPEPIAYFEHRSGGKLKESYYVCKYADNTQTLHELINDKSQFSTAFIQEFTKFCYELHIKGVLHRDFNPKNILISKINKETEFALVDINRITWSKALSLKKAMSSLSRLPFSSTIMHLVLESYAKQANTSLQKCQAYLEKSQYKTERYFRNKKRFRKIFPKR